MFDASWKGRGLRLRGDGRIFGKRGCLLTYVLLHLVLQSLDLVLLLADEFLDVLVVGLVVSVVGVALFSLDVLGTPSALRSVFRNVRGKVSK